MAHDRKNSKAGRNLSLAISAAVAGTGSAQAEAEAEDARLEEVIVTATKRDLKLQDTPLSVTAITDEEITLQRLDNFEDYVGQIPGLALSQREPGANSVIMRGCAAQGLSFSDSATTSVYLDEQPITSAGYNPDPRLVDVARIEALGGPQGSLFGDAAQCGTLRIITNKPDTSVHDGWLDVSSWSIGEGGAGTDLSGMVNVPLLEDGSSIYPDLKAAVRLVGFYANEPGWVDNVLTPTPGQTSTNSNRVDDDVNSSVWYGGRAGLRLEAGENWTVDLTGIYQYYEMDGFGDVSLNKQHFADTSVFPSFGPHDQARYTQDYWEDEWYQIALTLEGNLSFGDVVLTTAYYDRESTYLADSTSYLQNFQQVGDYFRSFNTGNPYYDTGGIYDFGGDPIANDFDGRQTNNWVIEARYATPTDGRWSAIVGAFYSKRQVDEVFMANVEGLTGTGAFNYINYAGYYVGIPMKSASNNWWTGVYDSDLKQSAFFGEVSVDVTENFTIKAGGRFYSIENDYIVMNGTLIGMNGGIPNCAIDYCYAPGDLGSSEEDGFVPMVNFSYRWENALVYATYSEGFRRGGANSARPQSVFGPPSDLFDDPAGTLNSYESDTVINHEIGAKTEWLDDRLRFNISFYQMTWENIQVQAEDPQDNIFTLGIVNFPEADIDGVEMWVSWLPNANWSVEATVGRNDGKLSQAQTLFADTPGAIPVPVGTQLPIVPDVKRHLKVMYQLPRTLFGGEPYIMLRYTYTGESVNSLAGIESISFSPPVVQQGSWRTLDIQAGVETDAWSASLYVDNVTDENGELFFNNRFAQQRLTVNQPRSFGFNFRYNFGGK